MDNAELLERVKRVLEEKGYDGSSVPPPPFFSDGDNSRPPPPSDNER